MYLPHKCKDLNSISEPAEKKTKHGGLYLAILVLGRQEWVDPQIQLRDPVSKNEVDRCQGRESEVDFKPARTHARRHESDLFQGEEKLSSRQGSMGNCPPR